MSMTVKAAMIAAALLDYPGQEWDDILTEVASTLAQLPAEAAAEFSQFLDWAGSARVARSRKPTLKPLIRSVAAAWS